MTEHACTHEACGAVTRVLCQRCGRVVAEVRRAHAPFALKAHDAAVHVEPPKPTQWGKGVASA